MAKGLGGAANGVGAGGGTHETGMVGGDDLGLYKSDFMVHLYQYFAKQNDDDDDDDTTMFLCYSDYRNRGVIVCGVRLGIKGTVWGAGCCGINLNRATR